MVIYNKVIIWGYPLDSHTHSYVHYCWNKTFRALGYDTYWFHDNNYPSINDFDYTNVIFITEGKCDNNIPLFESNMYIVHACINPYKYINFGARLVDLRYHVKYLHDSTYDYNLDERINNNIVQKISENSLTYYESNASPNELNKNYNKGNIKPYEAIYMFWATDLLPEEIVYEDRFIEPKNPYEMTFVGSIGSGNQNEINRYFTGCQQNNIIINRIDPWQHPVSFKEAQDLVRKSIVAPDIRGAGDPQSNHKEIGYIACRLFKNISYGKVGVTNSKRVKEIFGTNVLYHENETEIVNICLQNYKNYDYILKQMKWVCENHTYVNRVNDLLELISKNGDSLEKLKM